VGPPGHATLFDEGPVARPMRPLLLAAALFLVAPLAGCNGPDSAEGGDGVQVRFTLHLADANRTGFGSFVVETDAEETPKTVENFLAYVDSGYFVNLTFHRVAPGFVVQGGGYEADYKTRHTAMDPIPLEATAAKPNKQWTLSMARTTAPDSATSEFFVNLADNTNLDSTGPGTGYTVFAHVVSGQDTIMKMTTVEHGQSFGAAGGWYPKTPIVIGSAERVD
jgi:peptidyl-prolyl cis-trans isomerase A (cyclophilin A)